MASIHPRLMLRDLYGDGVALSSHLPLEPGPWVPRDPGVRDAISGAFLPIAGGTPLLCAASVATPAGLDLLEEAGLPRPTALRTFRDPAEYLAALSVLAAEGRPVAFHHRPGETDAAMVACAVPPTLLGELLDKACLGRWFDGSCLLPRRVLDALPADPADLLAGGPAVLKVATGAPHGGGLSVRPVRDAGEAEAACAALAEGPRWVLEAWVPFARSICVHAAALADGRCLVLGSAEQILEGGVVHTGNWLDAASDVAPDVETAVLEATRRAAAAGYRGLAGFDVGFEASGRWAVVDANFRLNASSTAVLLRDALIPIGARESRLTATLASGTMNTLLRVARGAMAQGWLVPLYTHDPTAGRHGGPALLRAVVRGPSRAEALARCRGLQEACGPPG